MALWRRARRQGWGALRRHTPSLGLLHNNGPLFLACRQRNNGKQAGSGQTKTAHANHL
jgi:hypothetical protein